MRLNTARSLELARRVKARYGTWQQVREAARLEDGVYILDAPSEPPPEHPRAASA